ncbi:MAG: arsenic resistance N-acetyltransferase ArsN2 [Thermoanaerobaculia bacterium]
MKTLADLRITPALPDDLPEVLSLLERNQLMTSDVEAHLRNFVIARDGAVAVACGGAEAYQFAALLRSIAVDPEYRGMGLGRRIVRELLDRLSSRGLREFYLLTEGAEEFFRKRGFKVIDRDQIHPQLLSSSQLQGACPESATCMRLVMS